MAAESGVSVEEYLRTSYRPDCDYLDGDVLERNFGERDHSTTQRNIILYFARRYPRSISRLLPEQRVQVSGTRFRVPDICVLADEAPHEQIIHTPPALCIEIVSPEDRVAAFLGRIHDYFEMGVGACWIIRPEKRRGWMGADGHLTEVEVLRSAEFEMPIAEVIE